MHLVLRDHTLIFLALIISVVSASVSTIVLSEHSNRNSNNNNNNNKAPNNNTSQPQSRQSQQRQQWPYSQYRGTGGCGTEEPSPALRDVHKRLSSTEYRHVPDDGDNAGTPSLPVIQIDTWFHIVSTSDQVDLVTNAMIADQFVYLQQAYSNTSIQYSLVGVDRSINDTWARNGDSLGMKRTLRRGSYSTLNIYFQTDLEAGDSAGVSSRNTTAKEYEMTEFPRDAPPPSSSPTPNLLGFCTLPSPAINSSSAFLDDIDYISDGCNILAATMPGGSIAHYNRGGTTVHEVGHWHGLLHTFQDQSCSASSEGDYIADTPQQSTPTDGCPASKDSCPDLPGLDAINNFMDYSSDDCYQNFTQDQAMRMRSMWETMREGK